MSQSRLPTVPPWHTVQLEAGSKFAMLLCESGHVFSWGENDLSQLGRHAHTREHAQKPTIVRIIKKYIEGHNQKIYFDEYGAY
jgi:alpha-tubulin suppressor-like RCC1 family protein